MPKIDINCDDPSPVAGIFSVSSTFLTVWVLVMIILPSLALLTLTL